MFFKVWWDVWRDATVSHKNTNVKLWWEKYIISNPQLQGEISRFQESYTVSRCLEIFYREGKTDLCSLAPGFLCSPRKLAYQSYTFHQNDYSKFRYLPVLQSKNWTKSIYKYSLDANMLCFLNALLIEFVFWHSLCYLCLARFYIH